MATITFTTRCTNKTVSLPSEEAIERLFDDADAWFAFQRRAPETEMELFIASICDAKITINSLHHQDRRQWRANGNLDKRGRRNRHPPRRMVFRRIRGLGEDRPERTAGRHQPHGMQAHRHNRSANTLRGTRIRRMPLERRRLILA